MTITHIVLFKFQPSATQQQINQACAEMLSLQACCVHPTSQAPYIRSCTGGIDNSPEGIQRDMTHAFVMLFDSVADRDYYVHTDPAHETFKRSFKGIIKTAQVLDFADGVFESQ